MSVLNCMDTPPLCEVNWLPRKIMSEEENIGVRIIIFCGCSWACKLQNIWTIINSSRLSRSWLKFPTSHDIICVSGRSSTIRFVHSCNGELECALMELYMVLELTLQMQYFAQLART